MPRPIPYFCEAFVAMSWSKCIGNCHTSSSNQILQRNDQISNIYSQTIFLSNCYCHVVFETPAYCTYWFAHNRYGVIWNVRRVWDMINRNGLIIIIQGFLYVLHMFFQVINKNMIICIVYQWRQMNRATSIIKLLNHSYVTYARVIPCF